MKTGRVLVLLVLDTRASSWSEVVMCGARQEKPSDARQTANAAIYFCFVAQKRDDQKNGSKIEQKQKIDETEVSNL